MMRLCHFVLAAAVLAAGPALAQNTPPATSLTPPDKPAVSKQAEEVETPKADETETDAVTPDPAPGPAPATADPAASLATTPADTSLPAEAETAAFLSCTEALTAAGAVFETVDAVRDGEDAACGISRPVRLDQAAPGVTLNPDTILRCETALALSKWVQRTVLPASHVLAERGDLTGLDHGSSYICRRRNNLPDGVLSEHSYGSAIDIMGVTFRDGSALTIERRERDGTLEEAFQDAVRAGACLYFTTVLGPGSDESHADHLHFDIKERNGGFRLCQ